MSQLNERRHVHLKQVEMLLQLEFQHRAVNTVTGIVHENGDVNLFALNGIENLPWRIDTGKIARDDLDLDPMLGTQFGGDLFEPRCVPRDEHKVIALSGEQFANSWPIP